MRYRLDHIVDIVDDHPCAELSYFGSMLSRDIVIASTDTDMYVRIEIADRITIRVIDEMQDELSVRSYLNDMEDCDMSSIVDSVINDLS